MELVHGVDLHRVEDVLGGADLLAVGRGHTDFGVADTVAVLRDHLVVWEWIFYINLPIGILAFVLAVWLVPAVGDARAQLRRGRRGAVQADKPEQLRRDELKNEIMRRYDLRLLRLPTTGSSEPQRIRRVLDECSA